MRALVAVGDEAEQKAALPHTRIANQQNLKRVIIVGADTTAAANLS